jgi:hypothetical protein
MLLFQLLWRPVTEAYWVQGLLMMANGGFLEPDRFLKNLKNRY